MGRELHEGVAEAVAGAPPAPAPMLHPEEVDDSVWQPSSRPSYYQRVISATHDRYFPAISQEGGGITSELVRPTNSPQRRLVSRGRRLGSGGRARRAGSVLSPSYPPKLSNREKQILERGTMSLVCRDRRYGLGGLVPMVVVR
jgi:hypothetical protein